MLQLAARVALLPLLSALVQVQLVVQPLSLPALVQLQAAQHRSQVELARPMVAPSASQQVLVLPILVERCQ